MSLRAVSRYGRSFRYAKNSNKLTSAMTTTYFNSVAMESVGAL